jgi:hypothetical protein
VPHTCFCGVSVHGGRRRDIFHPVGQLWNFEIRRKECSKWGHFGLKFVEERENVTIVRFLCD